jgi:LAS superfamily LD-carboxypeptidase LdcB
MWRGASTSDDAAMPERHVYRSRSRWADRALVGLFVGGVAAVAAIGIFRDRPLAGASQPPPLGTTATTAAPTELHPGLVAAFDAAQAAAADAGFTLVITDGFRSAATQQGLFDEEVQQRGSVEAASKWVFPPDKSMHVQGLAVDVGDGPAADWLAANGSEWGVCQTLGWEWWHFEWRQHWQDSQDCPGPVSDPSEAPGVDA